MLSYTGILTFMHFLSGSHRYSVIFSTRIHPIVRTAKARINGFGSSQSWEGNYRLLINYRNLLTLTKVLTAMMAISG